MAEDKQKARRDPTTLVAPFARVRIIVAIVLFCTAFAIIGYRLIFG